MPVALKLRTHLETMDRSAVYYYQWLNVHVDLVRLLGYKPYFSGLKPYSTNG